MNKKRILTAITAIILTLALTIPVSADATNYSHYQDITITDTGSTLRTYVPVMVTDIDGDVLIASGYTNSATTDTYMDDAADGSERKYMIVDDRVFTVVPSLPADGEKVHNLYMGTDDTQTSFPMIVGTGGYITTSDHADLEPGADFDIYATDVYIDTSTGNIGDTVFTKDDAVDLIISDTGEVTANIYGLTSSLTLTGDGATTAIPTLFGAATHWQSQLTNDADTSYVELSGTSVSATDLYTVSNTVPANAIIDSVTVSSVAKYTGGITNVYTAVYLSGTTTYSSAHQTGAAYATFSDSFTTKPGGGAWTVADLATTQVGIKLEIGGVAGRTARSTQVTATVNYHLEATKACATGEHDFIVSADTTNLTLSVDGATDSTALNGSSVPDNANDFVFMSDACPYAGQFRLYQGANYRINYQVTEMIDGTTLPNNQVPSSYEGAFTWGANADMTVVAGAVAASPSVTTAGATGVGATTVTLQGVLNSMGGYDLVDVYFEYGHTASYGSITSAATVAVASAFSLDIGGLIPEYDYHFRAVSRISTPSGDIYWYGSDREFTTLLAEGSSTDIDIRSVGLFHSYKATGDLLICVEAINRYSGLFPNESPYDYFQIQFLDTDGITILGASGLQNWGDRPISIYLNAASASTLTAQAVYVIKLYGYGLTAKPSITYSVSSEDWKGNDLRNLDNWCIGTAANMAIADEVDMSEYVTTATDKPAILSDSVSAYFTQGIPGISSIRPYLFNTRRAQAEYPTGTDGGTWESADAWEANVGAQIVNDITKIASPFGINARDALTLAVWLVVGAAVVYYMVKNPGISSEGLLTMSLPVLWIATQLKIIPISYFVGASIILVVVFAFMVGKKLSGG